MLSHFILFASVSSHLCRIAAHRIASDVAAQRSSPAYVVAETAHPAHLISSCPQEQGSRQRCQFILSEGASSFGLSLCSGRATRAQVVGSCRILG